MNSDVKMSDRNLQITRVFKAPRSLVYSWFTSAAKLSQWSGCKEAVRCDVEMDFRVGGGFTQTMQIADICEFTLTGRYTEIVESERIAYDVHFAEQPTSVTIDFRDVDGGTKVTISYAGFPDESFAPNIGQGTGESFDKLELLVDEKAIRS